MNKFDEVLDYLWEHCKDVADDSFIKFLEVINSEKFEKQSEKIVNRIKCDYSFVDYFRDRESLKDLMSLKETEPEKFYECLLAGSNWLNLMAQCPDINIQGQIILNTKDLFKSFIMKMGNKI